VIGDTLYAVPRTPCPFLSEPHHQSPGNEDHDACRCQYGDTIPIDTQYSRATGAEAFFNRLKTQVLNCLTSSRYPRLL